MLAIIVNSSYPWTSDKMANVSNDERFRMRVYRLHRDQFKADIMSFIKFLKEEPAPSRDRIKLLRLQLERLQEKHNTFQEDYRNLKLDNDSEIEHKKIVELYVGVSATAELLLEDAEDSAEPTDSGEANETEPSQPCVIVLDEDPRMEANLFSFDGRQKDWARFKEVFEKTAKNVNLSDSEKLRILRSKLSGKVKLALESYNDFIDAWNDLRDAYDNTRAFIIDQASQLLGAVAISKNSKESIQDFVRYMEIYMKWLQAVAPTDKDAMKLCLSSLAISKMDQGTRQDYFESLSEGRMLSIEHTLEYLRRVLVSIYQRNYMSRNREMPGASREDRSLSPSRKRRAMDA